MFCPFAFALLSGRCVDLCVKVLFSFSQSIYPIIVAPFTDSSFTQRFQSWTCTCSVGHLLRKVTEWCLLLAYTWLRADSSEDVTTWKPGCPNRNTWGCNGEDGGRSWEPATPDGHSEGACPSLSSWARSLEGQACLNTNKDDKFLKLSLQNKPVMIKFNL